MRRPATAFILAGALAVAALGGCMQRNSAMVEGTASPSATGASPDQASFAPPHGKLVFDAEFNSGTLDRAKWNVEGPGKWFNRELQAYADSPRTIHFASVPGADGGALVLQPVWHKGYTTPTGRKVDFLSGRINTKGKFALTYGRVAARIKLPANAGVWPAFWMLGYGKWPGCGEVDIMEYVGEPNWVSSAMHGPGYFGDTPIIRRYHFPKGSNVTAWHVYSVDRTPNSVEFSIDGKPFYKVTRKMIGKYGPWRFDRPEYIILNFAVGGNYPAKVNHVRRPYYGLPQSTVDAIKAGKVAMDVDWVRAWSTR